MTLFMRFETTAGDHIDATCRELQTVADKIGVIAAANFNDVKVYAQPGGSAEVLHAEWQKAFESNSDYKSAWSK